MKIFRCLKFVFQKTYTFLELHQSAAAAAMIFTIQKKYFRKPHIHTGLLKKKFEKIMKNIGDMAKRTFIKKPQFFLYVKTSACSHWEQLQKYKKSNKSCEICVSYQALGQF